MTEEHEGSDLVSPVEILSEYPQFAAEITEAAIGNMNSDLVFRLRENAGGLVTEDQKAVEVHRIGDAAFVYVPNAGAGFDVSEANVAALVSEILTRTRYVIVDVTESATPDELEKFGIIEEADTGPDAFGD